MRFVERNAGNRDAVIGTTAGIGGAARTGHAMLENGADSAMVTFLVARDSGSDDGTSSHWTETTRSAATAGQRFRTSCSVTAGRESDSTAMAPNSEKGVRNSTAYGTEEGEDDGVGVAERDSPGRRDLSCDADADSDSEGLRESEAVCDTVGDDDWELTWLGVVDPLADALPLALCIWLLV